MPAFKSHATATSDKAWDGPANKARVKSGEKRSYYGRIFAWYDLSGDEGVKETYKFIHHEVDADGNPGAANLTACSAGIGVLNGGRGGTVIPDADKSGVHAHLAKHLKDAGKEAPPLTKENAEDSLLFQTIQDRPWALLPAKLEEISAFIDRRLAGEKIPWAELANGKSGNKADEAYQVADGVAVIPILGTLDKRMNLMMRFSGGTSTELLARDIKQALIDPRVEAILLDIDSPGGAVDGTKDLADVVYAARQEKPVVAFANGLMASAAYWIGSAAETIVAGDTAIVGSIGVAMMHYDYSGQDEKLGIKRTAITAGKFKRIAGDERPLSAEGQAYLQNVADTLYGIFLDGVARNRGLDAETVHEKMGDGRLFIGKKAKRAGLVDALGNFNDALALAKEKGRKSMDLQTMQEKHPDLYAEVMASGKEEGEQDGFQAGMTAERARVVEIMEMDGPANLTLEAIKTGATAKEAAKQFWANRDQLKAQALDNLAAAAAPMVGQAVIETKEINPDLPLAERAKAEWDQDAKLRQEFPQFEAYLAFKKAENSGLVKIKGQ